MQTPTITYTKETQNASFQEIASDIFSTIFNINVIIKGNTLTLQKQKEVM